MTLITMGAVAAPRAANAAEPVPPDAAAPALQACGIVTTNGLNSTCAGGDDDAPISFVATVTAEDGSAPTGRVTFATDGVTLGTALLVSGVATLTTSTLPDGAHRIVAYYPGTADFDPSQTPLLIQRVGLGCPCPPTGPGGIGIGVNMESRSPASGQAGSPVPARAGSPASGKAGSTASGKAGSTVPGKRIRTRIVFGGNA